MAQANFPIPSEQPLWPTPGEENDKRQQIVNVAVRLFCEKGYEATSVREIVEALGVTKPVLYYYFKSKEDLLHYIVTRSMEEYDTLRTQIYNAPGLDVWQKLQALIQLHIQVAQENSDHVRFIHTIFFSGRYKNIFDFDLDWDKHHAQVIELIQQAQDQGLARTDVSPQVMAHFFLGACHNLIDTVVFCPHIRQPLPSCQDVMSLIFGGFKK